LFNGVACLSAFAKGDDFQEVLDGCHFTDKISKFVEMVSKDVSDHPVVYGEENTKRTMIDMCVHFFQAKSSKSGKDPSATIKENIAQSKKLQSEFDLGENPMVFELFKDELI
jgi:hypothetical protein